MKISSRASRTPSLLLLSASLGAIAALGGLAVAQPAPTTPAPAAQPAPAPADQTPTPSPSDLPAPTAQPVPTETPGPVVTAEPPPAKPADAPTTKAVEWTSLRLLRDKGVISEEEYSSAMKDLGVVNAGDAATLMVGKLKTTFYGFVQADYTYNSTQSCQEFCSNALIQKEGTYRGDNGRTNFSVRDSRIGFRIAAPEERKIRVSGTLEMDFFGPTSTTEQGTWVNPVLRVRSAFLKMETPIVDVMFGQNWSPLGWSAGFLITSAQEPGLPGQIFQRTSQLRLSRLFKSKAVNVELMAAAVRPPQADSATPEGAAGVRLYFNERTGLHSSYLTSTTINTASIAVTADVRRFRIAELSTAPLESNTRVGGAIAVNAFLPIISATKDHKDNALAVTGELAYGKGTSDLYTALGAAGTSNGPVPPATPGGMPGTYVPNFDPGFAAYSPTGKLDLIQWTSYIVGAELYPAGTGGRLCLFAGHGHMQSSNTDEFEAAPGRARESEDFYNAGLFFDPTKATRVGADLGIYDDHYTDGTEARNYSVMSSVYLFF